ncbi:hypothetical protein [Legionella sp. km772]|uniref:hypothetical protein n=1 Tax=Legionella sp. km772 TaxID=2498111 RepID=UPI000F8E1195|nr:hypothetical protein [Legionella sp. km772]RUR13812.1 hypothetical protein ELY15_01280 [Legionella sp. km772]
MTISKSAMLALLFCSSSWALTVGTNCSEQELANIHRAIEGYIKNDSAGASKGITINSEHCLSGYASALVHYPQPQYDAQVAYLRHDHVWKVLGVATGFDGEFMSKIPAAIQQ